MRLPLIPMGCGAVIALAALSAYAALMAVFAACAWAALHWPVWASL